MAFGIPANCIALTVKGDLAGMTLYTDRLGRKVWFPQAPPKDPPSPLQVKQRARFQTCITNWNALSQTTKQTWENMSLKAHLVMTGHNLFIHVSLRGAFPLLATLQRQTGISLDDPEFVPWPED